MDLLRHWTPPPSNGSVVTWACLCEEFPVAFPSFTSFFVQVSFDYIHMVSFGIIFGKQYSICLHSRSCRMSTWHNPNAPILLPIVICNTRSLQNLIYIQHTCPIVPTHIPRSNIA